jgi:hypothetical protein
LLSDDGEETLEGFEGAFLADPKQAGLMSRWTIPSACAVSNASAISMASDSSVSSSSGRLPIKCFKVWPSKNSMAMNA